MSASGIQWVKPDTGGGGGGGGGMRKAFMAGLREPLEASLKFKMSTILFAFAAHHVFGHFIAHLLAICKAVIPFLFSARKSAARLTSKSTLSAAPDPTARCRGVDAYRT